MSQGGTGAGRPHVGISGGPTSTQREQNARWDDIRDPREAYWQPTHGAFCQCLACRAHRQTFERGPVARETKVGTETVSRAPKVGTREKVGTLTCMLPGCSRPVTGGGRGFPGRFCSAAHKKRAVRALKRTIEPKEG